MLSPSLYRKMKPRIHSALRPAAAIDEFAKRQYHRFAQVFRLAVDPRFLDQQGAGQARQHEGGGDPEHLLPRHQVRQDQRQRARHHARHPIGVDVDRAAQALLVIRQQFAPVGIDHDVLAGRQKCRQRRHEARSAATGFCGSSMPMPPMRKTAAPGSTAIQPRRRPSLPKWKRSIKRRPQEFPGVGKHHQREQAECLDVQARLASQACSRLNRMNKRQAGGEAEKHANQDAAVEITLQGHEAPERS